MNDMSVWFGFIWFCLFYAQFDALCQNNRTTSIEFIKWLSFLESKLIDFITLEHLSKLIEKKSVDLPIGYMIFNAANEMFACSSQKKSLKSPRLYTLKTVHLDIQRERAYIWLD